MMDMHKIAVSVAFICRKFPYLSHIILSVPIKPSDNVPTLAASKGWNIYYNPGYVQSLDEQQVAALLYHEIDHLLKRHHQRFEHLAKRSDVDWMLVNISCDLETNQRVLQDELRLPPDVLLPERFDLPPGLLAEQYYSLLLQNNRTGLSSLSSLTEQAASCIEEYTGKNGSAVDGVPREWETEDEPLPEFMKDIIMKKIAQEIKKFPGKAPGHWQRWAEEILSSKCDWRAVLHSSFGRLVSLLGLKNTYSFDRPSRRHYNSQFFFPRLVSNMPKVAVLIDTSGSMSQSALSQALAEVSSLIKVTQCSLVVVCCDVNVQSVKKVKNVEHIELLGGGGTDLRNGLQELEKHKPDVAVVFTDGYTPWPETAPPFPVIVVLIGHDVEENVPEWVFQKVVVEEGSE